MRQPTGGFHEFLHGGAAPAFEQIQDSGGLGALADPFRRRGFLGRFGGLSTIESSNGALNPWQARQVVSQFITLLQESVVLGPSNPAPSSSDASVVVSAPAQAQMQPSVTLGSTTQERASWVTRGLLETLLPPDAFDLWADEGRDAPRMRRTRSVLRRAAPFVALVQGDREYVRHTQKRYQGTYPNAYPNAYPNDAECTQMHTVCRNEHTENKRISGKPFASGAEGRWFESSRAHQTHSTPSI